MEDVLIIGGGVIGLSLAYELATHGAQVRLIDRGQPGREASWAGAGILPPGGRAGEGHPLEQLAALSDALHEEWAQRLREETGLDNGYVRCGGIQLALAPQEQEWLASQCNAWRAAGIVCTPLDSQQLRDCEPQLQPAPEPAAAYLVPGEAQVRNPRHLKALEVACRRRGVVIERGLPAEEIVSAGERIRGVQTPEGLRSAGAYVLACGAWSTSLAERLGVSIRVKPVRGQIVLLRTPAPVLEHVVNHGARYLVPRPDGRLLVGSTEEEAGFDKRTTAAGVAGLLEFARRLVPCAADAEVERTWAGLRPGSVDGLPFLGRAAGFDNLLMAAGHFRAGLTLSTGTAQVLRLLLQGEEPEIDLSPFRADRTRGELSSTG